MFKRIILSMCLVAFGFAGLPAFAAGNFDLVIKNGRVMDPETGFDAVANVGINNGFITKITKDDITGTRTIDATGHVVAPGFIDGHVHYVDMPFGVKVAFATG